MAKAVIYTITVTKAHEATEEGVLYSLNPWSNNNLFYEGYDDGGKVFALPEGIVVGSDPSGGRILYDKNSGRSVELCALNGSPVLRYGKFRYELHTAGV